MSGRIERTQLIAALRAARPIIVYWRNVEFECSSTPEKKYRAGAVKTDLGYYYHIDTVRRVDALREIRRCDRALKKIDAAIKSLGAMP